MVQFVVVNVYKLYIELNGINRFINIHKMLNRNLCKRFYVQWQCSTPWGNIKMVVMSGCWRVWWTENINKKPFDPINWIASTVLNENFNIDTDYRMFFARIRSLFLILSDTAFQIRNNYNCNATLTLIYSDCFSSTFFCVELFALDFVFTRWKWHTTQTNYLMRCIRKFHNNSNYINECSVCYNTMATKLSVTI